MKHEMKSSATYDILVRRMKNSDVHAVETLFRQYYEPLVHYAVRYVNDTHIAENVVSDVFVRMWKNRHKIDFGVNIKTYLFNSVRNYSLNYLKKASREDTYKSKYIAIEYDHDTPESQLFEKETQQTIQNAVNELPPKCKEIFCMNRFDGLTYNEIASILDISIKTVETQMSHALKFLR